MPKKQGRSCSQAIAERRYWFKVLLVFGIAVLGGLLLYRLPVSSTTENAVQPPPVERVMVQRYELKNQSGRVQKNLYFWVYGAVEHTDTSRLLGIASSREYHQQTDRFGNRLLTFHIEQIPPYGSVIIENKTRLAIQSGKKAEAEWPEILESSLRAAPLIESDDPRIVKLARSFQQADATQRAEAIYQWVVGHIQVSDYQPQPLGAAKTLEMRQGDCTEFAHLYTAMARAANLPARVVAGYRHEGRALMRTDDLHNWAEVYLDGRWRIVDAHAKNFLQDETGYMAIQRLDMRGTGVLKAHQRYKVSNTAIQVRQF